MKKRPAYNRIIETADELRLQIAEWAQHQNDFDIAKLGAVLQSLRYDLDELESGNYDPKRILGIPPILA